jgi:hypothetical protein
MCLFKSEQGICLTLNAARTMAEGHCRRRGKSGLVSTGLVVLEALESSALMQKAQNNCLVNDPSTKEVNQVTLMKACSKRLG